MRGGENRIEHEDPPSLRFGAASEHEDEEEDESEKKDGDDEP